MVSKVVDDKGFLKKKVFEWQTPNKTCNMITWLAIVVVVDVLLLLFYFSNVVAILEGNFVFMLTLQS